MLRKIYFLLKSHETKQPIRQLAAKQTSAIFTPDLELRPAPLVFNCSIIEMHQFNDQFVKYIKSGSQTPPEGIDTFWLNQGFSKETNLEDFVMLIEDVASFKFTLNERRAGLFEATQTTDDPLDYLNELTQLIRFADWANLTPETAICHFFTKGVKCKASQQMCVKFMQEGGEDLDQLRDELKKITKETSAI